MAGGALLAHNLKATGHPGPARRALWGSIAYTVLVMVLAALLPEQVGGSWIGVATGLAGGLALTSYFQQLVPDHEAFPKRSIVKPLLICLAIFVPLLALVIYAALLTPAP